MLLTFFKSNFSNLHHFDQSNAIREEIFVHDTEYLDVNIVERIKRTLVSPLLIYSVFSCGIALQGRDKYSNRMRMI